MLTPRGDNVFITRRGEKVNIFTFGDYECSDHDRRIRLTGFNPKFNSLSFCRNIFAHLQSLWEDHSVTQS